MDTFKKKSAEKDFRKAVDNLDVELLRKVLRDPSKRKWIEERRLATTLHDCIRFVPGSGSLVMELLASGAPLDSLQRGNAGGHGADNIVHLAMRNWQNNSGPMLLQKAKERGIDFNAPGINNDTPLVIAIGKRQFESIPLLLEGGSVFDETTLRFTMETEPSCFNKVMDLVAESQDGVGQLSPLLGYWGGRRPDILLHFIEQGKLSPPFILQKPPVTTYKNYKCVGRTPILTVIVLENVWTVIRTLLQNGANIEAKDDAGQTALHAAVSQLGTPGGPDDKFESFVVLLRAGADLDARDNDGLDPISKFVPKFKPEEVHNLAAMCSQAGREDKAKVLFEQALRTLENLLGPEHESTLDTLVQLGNIHEHLWELDNAEHIYKKAFASYEKTLGPGNGLALDALYRLGNLYVRAQRWEEAEDLFEQSVAGYTKLQGEWSQQTLINLSSLANCHRRNGWLSKAEDYYLKVLEGIPRSGGLLRPSVMRKTYSDLAKVYRDWRPREAEVYWLRAIAAHEEAGGQPRPKAVTTVEDAPMGMITCIAELSDLYREQGRMNDAGRLEDKLRTIDPQAAKEILEQMREYRDPDAKIKAFVERIFGGK